MRLQMPYLGIFGPEFLKKLYPYLKSTPSKLSNCKFCKETQMSEFGTKYASFGYF